MENTVKKMKQLFNRYVEGVKEGEVTIDQFQSTFNKKFDDLLEEIEDEALNRRAEAEYMDWANSED